MRGLWAARFEACGILKGSSRSLGFSRHEGCSSRVWVFEGVHWRCVAFVCFEACGIGEGWDLGEAWGEAWDPLCACDSRRVVFSRPVFVCVGFEEARV